ncbi:MAG: hypothetical protein BECKG1743D_GA0114223_103582 [Candidatus Kentron sp. G]|nr:MAG: hypothetical protein BECKG1743E_GA0114224_101902 [Candidatus Kentron sp. G]VFM99028.1 MAG: hypothetical protein BECKG1743F_GA0114225_103634 [Candidatus Kentron sp. G]VFN02356.1 MAG: hypothetical protein BECKG1743D_GA0114223_103582 [Candidatus Kentron sp. G]
MAATARVIIAERSRSEYAMAKVRPDITGEELRFRLC